MLPIAATAALSAASLAVEYLPTMARYLFGPGAEETLGSVKETIKTVTGVESISDAALVLSGDPGKAAEFRVSLARIQADREAAHEAYLLEQYKATLADSERARQQTISLTERGNPLGYGAAVVTLIVLALFAWVVVAGVPTDAGMGETIKVLTVACVSYWVGSARGSVENRAMNGRLAAALVDRQPPSAAPIINQPTGTVISGATTDDLNNASWRAARGG